MMLVGGVLLIVVAMVIAGANSHKPTAAQIAAAQAFSHKQFNQCMRGQYLEPGDQFPPGYGSLQEYCDDVTRPHTDTGLQLSDGALLLEHTSTFVVLLGVALAVAFVTLLLQAILFGSFSLAVALRGTSLGAPSGLLGTAALTGLRVSTVAVGFGLVALAIATIGRSTVAALGVLFGYLVLFEGVIAGLRPSIQDRLLVRAGGVIVSQQPIYDERAFVTVSPGHQIPVLLGLTEAWVVAAVYVVVLMVLALLVFRTRDVN